jgi:Family of unknown function (DUF6157)
MMNQMSRTHTTNYKDTFIQVAEDCPVAMGEVPPTKGPVKTMATLQFNMLIDHPYQYTSDEVLFECYAQKNSVPPSGYREAREIFFSKGQPCFRASPLTKRYGWGVHADEYGKIAIYAQDSTEYRKLASNKKMQQLKAMKGSKK